MHPAARPALELLAELGPPAGVGLGAARAVVGIPGDARLRVFGGLGWLLGDAPANESGAATVPVLMEAVSDEAVAAMAWHEAAAVAALMGVPPRRRATFLEAAVATVPDALLSTFGLPGSRDAAGAMRRMGLRAGPALTRAAPEGVFARVRGQMAVQGGAAGE